MSQVTREKLEALKQKGLDNAAIGRIVGLSREMVRRYVKEFGLKSYCAKCQTELTSHHMKYCPECRKQIQAETQQKYARPQLKTFGKRPVVMEAHEFFVEMGLDVVLNAESKRSEPELFVNGHGVKCNVMIPVSKGHQVRLGPNADVEWFFLSDGDRAYVIPADVVRKRMTYIGQGSSLRVFSVGEWGQRLKGEFA